MAVDVPLCVLPKVTTPEPLTWNHEPVPTEGVLPAKVAAPVKHAFATDPAVAVVGVAVKVTEHVAVLAVHGALAIVHVAT